MTQIRQSPSGPPSGVAALLSYPETEIPADSGVDIAVSWPAATDGSIGVDNTGPDQDTMISHVVMSAGQSTLRVLNLKLDNTAEVNFNSTTAAMDRDLRTSPSGEKRGFTELATYDFSDANINPEQSDVVGATMAQDFVEGSLVALSPTAALPAGIALAGYRGKDDNKVNCYLANLTGADIAVGNVVMAVAVIDLNLQAQLDRVDQSLPRRSPSGQMFARSVDLGTQDAGTIAAQLVTEISIQVADVRPGDVVVPTASAGLPVNVGISHGRCETAGEVIIGFANPRGAGVAVNAVELQALIIRGA